MKTIDFLIIPLVVLAAAAVFFMLAPSPREVNKLQRELQEKQQTLEELQVKDSEVQRQAERLRKEDPEAIEKVARDKFGYARPNEEVYQIEKPQKEPNAPAETKSETKEGE